MTVAADDGNGDVATFLLADLAGYTALTEAHGDRRAAEVAAEFCAAVRELADDYGATEVKTIGDAVLLRVADPGQAVHLGARLVNDLGARHRSLGVRVGMHTGSAVQRGDDWFGAGVNVAARVAAIAEAGEVLLTAETQTAAGDAVPAGQLRSRGPRRLKNVARPVDLVALEVTSDGPLPLDPVCQMAVDPRESAHQVSHRGTTYHFCSDACQSAFDAAPESYVGTGAGRELLLVRRSRGGPFGSLVRAVSRPWRRRGRS